MLLIRINAPERGVPTRHTHKWDAAYTHCLPTRYLRKYTHKHKPHGLYKGLTPRAKALTPQRPIIAEIAAAVRVHVRRRAVKAL